MKKILPYEKSIIHLKPVTNRNINLLTERNRNKRPYPGHSDRQQYQHRRTHGQQDHECRGDICNHNKRSFIDISRTETRPDYRPQYEPQPSKSHYSSRSSWNHGPTRDVQRFSG